MRTGFLRWEIVTCSLYGDHTQLNLIKCVENSALKKNTKINPINGKDNACKLIKL